MLIYVKIYPSRVVLTNQKYKAFLEATCNMPKYFVQVYFVPRHRKETICNKNRRLRNATGRKNCKICILVVKSTNTSIEFSEVYREELK